MEQAILARAYHAILRAFVRDGRAPAPAELATALGLAVEDVRAVQQALVASHLPLELDPATEMFVVVPPFSRLPTRYRVAVAGQQRWYAL